MCRATKEKEYTHQFLSQPERKGYSLLLTILSGVNSFRYHGIKFCAQFDYKCRMCHPRLLVACTRLNNPLRWSVGWSVRNNVWFLSFLMRFGYYRSCPIALFLKEDSIPPHAGYHSGITNNVSIVRPSYQATISFRYVSYSSCHEISLGTSWTFNFPSTCQSWALVWQIMGSLRPVNPIYRFLRTPIIKDILVSPCIL